MTAETNQAFRKLAAVAAVLSAPIAYTGEYFGFSAIHFDPTIFSNPAALVALGPESAALFRWDWTLALFGFYLLLAPAVLYLWCWLHPHNEPVVTLLTLGGLSYVFLGAAGSAINAVIWPELVAEYATATPEKQVVIESVFGVVATGVVAGLWGILGRTVAAIWWIGIGWLLRRERRWLGTGTMLVGVFSALAAIGEFLLIAPIINAGTTGVLLLAPLWALWLGIDLWRSSTDPSKPRMPTSAQADSASSE